tara:strand:+ start:1633 stop:5814 length:4182 start_codon:yes stop_codon:yes gene_type:complete
MAEARNSFIKSKMNKDLDARLIPSGEYRDAQNVSVSKSEGADVGSLENILGNISLTDFGLTSVSQQNIDIIGFFMDVNSDRIFLFMTNFVDTSSDRLSNFATSNAECHIAVYNVNTTTSTILVSGNFLNFSKTNPVLGVNLINDSLFFTDNRNQPRKINVSRALNSSTYYTNEDQISLSKYYPYEPISLNENRVTGITQSVAGTGYPIENNIETTGGSGTGLTVDIISATGLLRINNPGTGYTNGDSITPVQRIGGGSGAVYSVVVKNITTMQDVVSELLPDGATATTSTAPASGVTILALTNVNGLIYAGQVLTIEQTNTVVTTVSSFNRAASTITVPSFTLESNARLVFNKNPYYDSGFSGDKDFLKDKFVRFAYRFKFDNGEYSLISPFTQECFIPQQDGYFMSTPNPSIGTLEAFISDSQETFKTTEVSFMQNKVNNIELLIPSPAESTTWASATTDLRIESVDIIFKQSNQTNLKLLETISSSTFSSNNGATLRYNYQSTKPFQTLPTRDLLRVYDQVPVRALAQEVIGNRLVFGNFLDKHTPPEALNYNTKTGFKVEDSGPSGTQYDFVRREYQNHTLKQNRTYQVGVVLSDKYGRQSDVILTENPINSQSTTLKNSTIFNPYKSGTNNDTSQISASTVNTNNFSVFSSSSPPASPLTNNLINLTDTWPGDQLRIQFNTAIASNFNSQNGTPGLWSTINPLGWYSYKVVVKQTQTDYYNVYCPGILNGYIDGESVSPLVASLNEPIAHFVIHADNLNKIPKDNTLLGPNQNLFRTGRPSFNDDPNYYQFTDTNGVKFQVDPYTEEGEALLKTRDRERDLDSGSQVDNASVKLSTRVINTAFSISSFSSRQYYPDQNLETVTTIGTGSDLGLYDLSSIYPYNVAHVFYNYSDNPFIGRLSMFSAKTQEQIQAFGQTGPSSRSAEYQVELISIVTPGIDYPGTGGTSVPVVFEGTKNLPTYPSYQEFVNKGIQIAFKVGVTATITNTVTHVTITNEGSGWDAADFPGVGYIEAVATIAAAGGATKCDFLIRVTKQDTYIYDDGPDPWPRGKRLAMQPIFSVFETTPLESKLDIYWETSTAGKIADLNTQITANDNFTPYGFADVPADSTGTTTQNSLSWPNGQESMGIGTPLVGLSAGTGFLVADYDGDPITIANNGSLAYEPVVSLLSVTDSATPANTITSDFEVIALTALADGSQPYQIRNTVYKFFGNNSSTNDIYNFTLRVVSPTITYATDGTSITRDLTFQMSPGSSSYVSPFFRLYNNNPIISITATGPNASFTSGSGCGGAVTVNDTVTSRQLVVTYEVKNGTNLLNTSGIGQDMTVQFITGDETLIPYFTVEYSSGSTSANLYAEQGTNAAFGSTAKTILVRVSDGGGQTADCSIEVSANS